MGNLAAMLCLGALLFIQTPAPASFRAVFEDRPRQLVVRFGGNEKDGKFFVFSPDTCAIRKIWRGGVQYRGKVYDFSQDNSSAKGTPLFEVISEALNVKTFGVQAAAVADPSWRFDVAGQAYTSKPFAVGAWGPLYLAFEEQGDTASFEVAVRRQNEDEVIRYLSSNTILGPQAWQWNYKQIPHWDSEPGEWTVEFKAGKITAPKRLRRIRLFGDRLAWFDSAGKALAVRFGGYSTLKGSTSVAFAVGKTNVALQAVETPKGYDLTYTIYDGPNYTPITLRHYQNGTAIALEPGTHPMNFGDVTFARPGTYRLQVGAR